MEITEQQIQERAKQIGDRPYHPVVLPQYRYTEQKFTGGVFIISPDENQVFAYTGITIRQELMRTAMGGLTSNDQWTIEFKVNNDWDDYIKRVSGGASELANALLLEMARQELGVSND